MLALKLILVPAFLLAVTFAGRRWGAQVAGWLAGLPVVAGPILYILALEQGNGFAATAATASLAAVFASVSFSVTYAHVGLRLIWVAAVAGGLLAWLFAVSILAIMELSVPAAAALALVTLLLAPHVFPAMQIQAARSSGNGDLLLRAIAGAGLTVAVAFVAPIVGGYWSGLLAVFPVLGFVLAVFSHREQGAHFAASLLRGMATGLYSFCAFCLSLALALERLGVPTSFAIAILASIAVQTLTKRLLTPPSNGQPPAAGHDNR